MTLIEVEDQVTRWHFALFGDLISGRIIPVQFVAGIQIANEWGLERHAGLFAADVQEIDICPTTNS